MFKVYILACLLCIATANPLLYSPTYIAAVASHLPAGIPLAYATRARSETYNSVATPNQFQQQYRSDYTPLTYSAGYLY